MKRFWIKLLISVSLLFISLVLLIFICETRLRIEHKGLVGGIRSYFVIEPPYSVLGTSNLLINDEILGYRLNPSRPEINKYSMKESEIKVPKPNGVKRIIILGDSLPFVGTQTFVDLLKKKFTDKPKIEIFNASTPGYTNYQELIFLKKYLLNLEPDLVVLNYVVNDNYKFLHQFDEKANMLFTQEAKDSLKINNSLDKFISQSYFLSSLKASFIAKDRENERKKLEFPWDASEDFNTAWKDESWQDIYNQIDEMNRLVKNKNAKLIITVFPLEAQLDKNLLDINLDYVVKPQSKISYYAKKRHIPFLDLFPVFDHEIKKIGYPSLYTDGLHLSTRGHSISAKALYSFIIQSLN